MKLIELSILGVFDIISYIIISGKIANQYKDNKKSYILLTILFSILTGIASDSSLRNYSPVISVVLLIFLSIINFHNLL